MLRRTSDYASKLNATLDSLAQRRPSLWTRSACGITRSGHEIPVLLEKDAYIPRAQRARVLLLSGISGGDSDSDLALQALDMFASSGQRFANGVALSAVPCGYPDGGSSKGYPPQNNFYYDHEDPEARYLWRWVCFQAPDLVLEVLDGERVQWEANQAAKRLAPAVGAKEMRKDESLLAALGTGIPDGLGQIPGLRLTAPEERLAAELSRLLHFIPQFGSWEPSPARRALEARRSRSRLQVAGILDSVYGHALGPINYTQGVAISGRLRLAELNPDNAGPASEIAAMLDTTRLREANPFGDQPSGANLAGVVWGPELAQATGDRRWAELLVQAADHFQPAATGEAPPPADPDFRSEDMFMCGAVLGRAYQATGQMRYIDLLTKFLMDLGTQQDNGLFWHCRSAPYLWGRGNGFAAMGLAESLTHLPDGHSRWQDILDKYLKIMDALRRLQQPSGMFPQVLDAPGSYQEFTATCMFGYSAARGLRMGWLDPSFLESLQLAWQGVAERIDDEGHVVDACASTGVQDSLEDYLDRPAVFGYDDRSGGMALWFAVELERLAQDSPA